MKHIEELALGGGAARGSYQFAFVRTLMEEGGYKIDHISGVSAGALNAYQLSAGMTDRGEYIWKEEIPTIIGRLDKLMIPIRVLLRRDAMFSNFRIWDMLQRFVDLKSCKIPITIYTVNEQGHVIGWDNNEFTDDDEFRKVIMGAAAIPVMFPPVPYAWSMKRDENWLVDAGIRAAIPPPQYPGQQRTVITTKNDIEEPEVFSGGTWFRAFLRSFDAMTAEIGRGDLQTTDWLVNPPARLPAAFDFSPESIAKSYEIGRQQALRLLEERIL